VSQLEQFNEKAMSLIPTLMKDSQNKLRHE
jgi:hypothetical protein